MEPDSTLPALALLATALVVDDDEESPYPRRQLLLQDGLVVHTAAIRCDAVRALNIGVNGFVANPYIPQEPSARRASQSHNTVAKFFKNRDDH